MSDYDLEWGAPCDTLCLNWSQAVCLLSVGGLAAGKQERRTCGQPVDQILWNVTLKKPCWKVKRGDMDFSQYFWSVPSRLDELSGGIQRQETFLETFLVNSLQVEIQKLNSYKKKHDPVALYLILNVVLNCVTSCRCTIIYRLSHLPSSFLDPLHLWRSQVPLHGSLFFKWRYIGG